MAENDRNTHVENLVVTESFTDPGETTHTGALAGGNTDTTITLENTDGAAFMTTDTLHAGTNLAWVDDGDGTATLNATDTDTTITLENTDGAALMTTDTLHAGDNLAWVDDGDGTATLNATDTDTVYTDEMAQDAVGTILSGQFTYDDATPGINIDPHVNTADAHHAKTQPSEVTSANWGDYEIQVNGTDGPGIINFTTE